MYYLEKYYDNQSISSNNADVNFDADVQKRKELLAQPRSDGLSRNRESMGFTPIIHSAAAISTGNEEAEENYPNFDSACSTVLTNSLLNCRQVEEHSVPIMQAESGVRMHSTHKGKKTYYLEARDGSIHSMEFDALIVPSLKQDLIGGRAVANGLDFQVILDKTPLVCGIYPRLNRELCGIEQSIPFISDDWRLFRLKTLNLVHQCTILLSRRRVWIYGTSASGTFPTILLYELWAIRMESGRGFQGAQIAQIA